MARAKVCRKGKIAIVIIDRRYQEAIEKQNIIERKKKS